MNNLFQSWLTDYFGTAAFSVAPLAGDASFRLYYRVTSADKTFIAMNAAAEKEKCPQFVAIADALRAKGLCTPEFFAKDMTSGFLLLSDFGDDQYLRKLTPDNMESLYGLALDALSELSTCREVSDYQVPVFAAVFMREELKLFQEWFLEKYLGLELSSQTQKKLGDCFDLLVEGCAQQPQVFMHRDFHSANLMVLPGDRVGILDFQDAFIGPVTYDLVSLLRDCYIECPEDLLQKLVLQYRDKLKIDVSDAEFMRWFDWMGMQRHLKALLTFSRKYCRDHNANYLQFIPRTLNYLLRASSKYPEMHDLYSFLREFVTERENL
jgi:aminoglycoside/choline kinase family phosphotransferase